MPDKPNKIENAIVAMEQELGKINQRLNAQQTTNQDILSRLTRIENKLENLPAQVRRP